MKGNPSLRKHTSARALRIVGSALILAGGIYLLRWDRLLTALSRVNFSTLLLAVTLAAASVAIVGLRWTYITRHLVHTSSAHQWRIYLLATFLNSFTPANIGGDVYRVVALRSSAKGSISTLVAALAVERVLGLCSFFIGYLLSLLVQLATSGQGLTAINALFLYPAAPIAVALVLFPILPFALRHSHVRRAFARCPALARHVRSFNRGITLATRRNSVVLVLLSLLAWATWIGTTTVVAARLELHIPIALLAMIATLTELVRLVPVSFQGIGVREVTFSALAGLAGASREIGFAVAVVTYATLSASLALAGFGAWLLDLATPAALKSPAAHQEGVIAGRLP